MGVWVMRHDDDLGQSHKLNNGIRRRGTWAGEYTYPVCMLYAEVCIPTYLGM